MKKRLLKDHRRLALLVFSCVVLPAVLPAVDLDSLLIQSVGGPAAYERLKTVSTIYAEGSVSLNGQPGSFEMYLVMPDKMYLEVQLGPFTITQAYDGITAWQRGHNGSITELSGYEKQDLLNQVYLQTYSYLFTDRLPGATEYMGQKEKEEKPCHEIQLYPLNRDTLTVYLDIKTGLQVCAVSNLDNLVTVTVTDDYREIEEVQIAFHSLATASPAPVTSEFTIDNIIFDQGIDPEIFRRPTVQRHDYGFPPGSDSVVIPFDFVAGHIYVSAIINGLRKLRLILDSGASANIFHEPALADLELPVVGELPAKGISGFEQVRLVRTDSITVGELALYSQVAGMLDLSGIGRSDKNSEPFGGILGFDFLSRFPILIDYQARTLTVYNPTGFARPEGGSAVPFHLTMQVPTIQAELTGVQGDFLVDLGNAFGLILHEDFAVSRGLLNKLDDIQETQHALGGIGGGIPGKSAYAASFAFGDVRITSIRVLIPKASGGLSGSAELAGNIGNLLLQQFRVLFDYGNQQLVFYDTVTVEGSSQGDD